MRSTVLVAALLVAVALAALSRRPCSATRPGAGVARARRRWSATRSTSASSATSRSAPALADRRERPRRADDARGDRRARGRPAGALLLRRRQPRHERPAGRRSRRSARDVARVLEARRPEPLRGLGDDLARRRAERRLQRRPAGRRGGEPARPARRLGRDGREHTATGSPRDGLHGNETGYRERARAVAEAVTIAAPRRPRRSPMTPVRSARDRRGRAPAQRGRAAGGRARERRLREGGARDVERDERAARDRAGAAVPRPGVRRGALPRQDVERARLVPGGRAARRSSSSTRPSLLVGFSMGGAVSIGDRRPSRRRPACSASRRGSPSGCRSTASAGSGSTSSTGPGTAICPGIPGVSPASSRQGFERARGARHRGHLHADPARPARRRAPAPLGRDRAAARVPARGSTAWRSGSSCFRPRARQRVAERGELRGLPAHARRRSSGRVYRLEVRGQEHIPPTGPLVVAGEPRVGARPVRAGGGDPAPDPLPRQGRALARTRSLRWWLAASSAIPVVRGGERRRRDRVGCRRARGGRGRSASSRGRRRREGPWLRGAARMALATGRAAPAGAARSTRGRRSAAARRVPAARGADRRADRGRAGDADGRARAGADGPAAGGRRGARHLTRPPEPPGADPVRGRHSRQMPGRRFGADTREPPERPGRPCRAEGEPAPDLPALPLLPAAARGRLHPDHLLGAARRDPGVPAAAASSTPRSPRTTCAC